MTRESQTGTDGLASSAFELLDLLYHARVGLRPENAPVPVVNVHENRTTFPQAQRILDGTDDSKLFPRVQRALGLLQTVILYGIPSDEPTRALYALRHVDTSLDLGVPWLAVTPSDTREQTWQSDPSQRRGTMNLVFKRFRDDPARGVHEFVELLTNRDRLSRQEERLSFVLVSDAEQSFFSLLWCLLEAFDDDSGHADAGNWIQGAETITLRSMFCHSHFDGPPSDVEPGETRCLQPLDWSDHYWRRAKYREALEALGLLASDGDGTARLERLARWINRLGRHPCLRAVRFKGADGEQSLEDALDGFVRSGIITPDIQGLRRLGHWATSTLGDPSVTFLGRNCSCEQVRRSSDSLRDFGLVRFNLPGEYLLRRNESIDRTFFATPLNEVYINEQKRPYTTAFALGTLVDVEEEPTPSTLFRLKVLRQILDAVAQFGLAERMSLEAMRVERGRQEALRLTWLRHLTFTALERLQKAIESSRPMLEKASEDDYQYLWDQYCRLFTLLEYFTDSPRDSKWPRDPHSMLRTIARWLGGRTDRRVSVDCLGPNPTLPIGEALVWYIVLANLVHNAIKFANEGGRVDLRCAPDVTRPGTLHVAIENSGETMPRSYVEYLEGSMTQPPTAMEEGCLPHEGLSTVRLALLQRHFDFPRVEAPIAELGEGTRVILRIPYVSLGGAS